MLSNKGLTSSEANHITNITKELVKDLSASNMPLHSSVVVKGNVDYPLDENKRNENWVKDIKRVGELYSLSAWLKSGIKLKENLLDETSNSRYYDLDKTVYEQGVDAPKVDFETYLDTLSVKDRNEYLSNEATASHVGKFIHNFDSIRGAMDKFQPTSFEQINNEVVTVKNTRLYSKEELLNGFFDLQKQHRESEKIVNYYKAKHKEWVKEVSDVATEETKAVNFRNSQLQKTYAEKHEKERLEFETAKREKMTEISNQKIVIPNELQNTLDFVNQYAKK
jgi:hypothetical protein